MLDDVQAQLTGGREQLVDDLAVGPALEPLPGERGQVIAAMGIIEPLELDQGISPVALGDPRKRRAFDPGPERVDDGSQMHPGEPAPNVEILREHELDRQSLPGGGGDEAGEPAKGIGVDEALLSEVDRGDATVQIERQHAVEMARVQAGAAEGRHEREYRPARECSTRSGAFCG